MSAPAQDPVAPWRAGSIILRNRVLPGALAAPERAQSGRPRPFVSEWGVAFVAVLIALSLALGVRPGAAQDSRPGEKEEDRPYPVLATGETRSRPKVLADLERPGVVLHSHDFESADALEAYFEVRGAADGRVRVDDDPRIAHSGRGALRCLSPAVARGSSGSGASFWFGPQGHDRVHLRYYIRFAPDYDQGNLNHTGGSLSGVAGADKWSGMGGAGIRPKGDDHFSTRLEAWRDWGRVAAPGYLFLYTYWMDMKRDRDGHFWGNMLGPEPAARIVPDRDRWLCCEIMVRVNDVGKANGDLAAWVDGRLHAHWTGFRWRSTDAVRLKRFDLGVYVHEARKDNVVWFDDVILSTGYVGPKK
jgi:hypothetical protein